MAQRPPLTHFLCLPLVTEASKPQLLRGSQEFRNRLIATKRDELNPQNLGRAIRPVSTLHLTLGVMSLTTPDRIEGATRLLQELDVAALLDTPRDAPTAISNDVEQCHWDATTNMQDSSRDHALAAAQAPSSLTNTTISDASSHTAPIDTTSTEISKISRGPPAPMIISLSGLSTMKKASKTSNLIATPHDKTGRLLPFCHSLRTVLSDAGYLVNERRDLNLHATVLNTLYMQRGDRQAQSSGGSSRTRWKKKAHMFDAREIIDGCQDLVWVERIQLDRIAMCKMGAEKIRDEGGIVVDERYEEVVRREIPR